MGFLGPRKPGLVEQAGVELDPRGNVAADIEDYRTSVPKIFAAATCGAASRWWSGRSARAASARGRSTSS